ncbi:MAG TPA: CBS domain-containing protein [Terriglobia bacterium]|nr:CBS domain-containing protein [Terriglobia bacterium]
MTKDPFCCEPMDSAQHTGQLMKERNVGAIPICESMESKRLLGIVTDRDLALRVVAEGRDPKTACIGDVMTQPVFTCRPEDPVEKALQLMERHQVRRIPVVDQQGRILASLLRATSQPG